MPESINPKLPFYLRLIAAAIAVAIGFHQIAGYKVARSINLQYFNAPAVPMTAFDIGCALLAFYLLVVAVSGRWRPCQRAS